ncbi:hypothetical protein, partial [Mesorhizobium sp. CU2]|uniref:hypothetical protein n=1 Tax=Mesorhizobium sp. CU2 TaxID=2589985 RepID=UPI001AEE36E2
SRMGATGAPIFVVALNQVSSALHALKTMRSGSIRGCAAILRTFGLRPRRNAHHPFQSGK